MEQEYKEKMLVRNDSKIDRGGDYYRVIKSITFKPMIKIQTFTPEVKKGETWWWKLFGLIPVIPIKAKENLFRHKSRLHNDVFRYCTIKELFLEYYDYERSRYTLVGNDVYRKPYVSVTTEPFDRAEMRIFDNDKDAIEYFDHIEEMCKKYGNSLKNKQEKQNF